MSEQGSGPRTALVVEDDASLAHLLRIVLGQRGYEVAHQADGSLAASSVRELRPDVVLLDVGLPNADGFEVLAELKADPDVAGIPVVLVTAWSSPELARRATLAGAAAIVGKPFDLDELGQVADDARAGRLPQPRSDEQG